MPKFSAGDKVKITKAATAQAGTAAFVGRIGTVRRMHQVGPGGFIVDVAFEGEEYPPALWEIWLEKA